MSPADERCPSIRRLSPQNGKQVRRELSHLCIRDGLQLDLLPLPKTLNPSRMRDNAAVDFIFSEADMDAAERPGSHRLWRGEHVPCLWQEAVGGVYGFGELTFRNQGGAVCRSFAAETMEGVACHEGKEWQLKGLLSGEPVRTGDYRLASSAATAEMVDNLIAGEAMDRDQERASQAAGWASKAQ